MKKSKSKSQTQKEYDQVNMMAQLMSMQEKLAEQEKRLQESEKKEEELAEQLEEQKQISLDLKDDIKIKDAALQVAEERLKSYE